MTTSQVTVKALAALALVAGFASLGRAQPGGMTAEKAFEIRPKQPGVNVSTPAPDAVPRCKVSPIANPQKPGQSMGYLVTDPDGKPVRQLITYDNKSFNVISFYLDGVEAYREVYPSAGPDGKPAQPFQFRWLGPNGSKWGFDRTFDFVVDEWVVISPEEVSQEMFRAVQTGDVRRLVPLMLTREHLTDLGLPAADVNALVARANGAGKRLDDTHKQLKLTERARWDHADFGIPFTRPADSFGGTKDDFTSYKNGTAFVIEDGGKTVLFQTGELVQIGRSWKVVDGPSLGGGNDERPVIGPEIKALVDELNAHDQKQPAEATVPALAAHSAKRAEILEKIVAAAQAKDTWVRMLIDSHQQAAEGGKADNAHVQRLRQWRDEMSKPGGNPGIAAYAAYRVLIAENSIALAGAGPNDFATIQEKWRAGLQAFVTAFPASADAPDAVLRLAMAHEMSGAKDAEAKAKEWFGTLAKNYAAHPHAAKAAGALKRLDSEGKPLELTGPALANPAQQVNAAQKDKVVVVYYWASWSDSLVADAKKLDALVKAYEAKGLALVTVGLDHDAKAASDAVARVGLPGTHLYAPGGLDGSPLAAAYGITAPPHVFVAGKDGKVVNRNGHVATLEDDIKKLLGEK